MLTATLSKYTRIQKVQKVQPDITTFSHYQEIKSEVTFFVTEFRLLSF